MFAHQDWVPSELNHLMEPLLDPLDEARVARGEIVYRGPTAAGWAVGVIESRRSIAEICRSILDAKGRQTSRVKEVNVYETADDTVAAEYVGEILGRRRVNYIIHSCDVARGVCVHFLDPRKDSAVQKASGHYRLVQQEGKVRVRYYNLTDPGKLVPSLLKRQVVQRLVTRELQRISEVGRAAV